MPQDSVTVVAHFGKVCTSLLSLGYVHFKFLQGWLGLSCHKITEHPVVRCFAFVRAVRASRICSSSFWLELNAFGLKVLQLLYTHSLDTDLSHERL